MGDLIDWKEIAARSLAEEDTAAFEAFLAAEGLALLSAFKSIEHAATRASILQMVEKVACALRPKSDVSK